MEVKTQIVIVGAVAVAWAGGQWVRVRPVLDRVTEAERMSLGALEQQVAQRPDDTVATRVLLRRYLDLGMPRVVTDTVRRAPPGLQRDGVVSLVSARAEEQLGNVVRGDPRGPRRRRGLRRAHADRALHREHRARPDDPVEHHAGV
jgi:hypothetical protein